MCVRSGFGVSERTDGLKYVGEWYNNKKYGYGVTTLRDGTKEEGKYKNNVLVSSGNKSKLLFAIRSSKLRERIDSAVAAAVRAGQIAKQKADIAVSRYAITRISDYTCNNLDIFIKIRLDQLQLLLQIHLDQKLFNLL